MLYNTRCRDKYISIEYNFISTIVEKVHDAIEHINWNKLKYMFMCTWLRNVHTDLLLGFYLLILVRLEKTHTHTC